MQHGVNEGDVPIMRIYDGEVRDLPGRKSGESLYKFYSRTLSYFLPGVYGEAELLDGELVQLVIHYISGACLQRNLGITVISVSRGTVFFKVIENMQTEFDLEEE